MDTESRTIPEALRKYDLNAERPSPRVIEVDATLLPEISAGFCTRHHIRLYAVIGYENEVGNIKVWGVGNMLFQAYVRGEFVGKKEAMDSTSGNAALAGAAWIAENRRRDLDFPLEYMRAVLPETSPAAKVELLKAAGCVLRYAKDSLDAQRVAQELGQEKNIFYLRQYWNPDNSAGYVPIGHAIAKALPELGLIAIGVGSAGTFSGVVPALQAALPKTERRLHRVAVIVEAGSESVDGVRNEAGLEPGTLLKRKLIDDTRYVSLEESLKYSAALWQKSRTPGYESCFGGPSAGFALRGLLLALSNLADRDRLDDIRDEAGDIRAAFIAPDTCKPYLEKYKSHGIRIPAHVSSWIAGEKA